MSTEPRISVIFPAQFLGRTDQGRAFSAQAARGRA
jgi:hypothetical protein